MTAIRDYMTTRQRSDEERDRSEFEELVDAWNKKFVKGQAPGPEITRKLIENMQRRQNRQSAALIAELEAALPRERGAILERGLKERRESSEAWFASWNRKDAATKAIDAERSGKPGRMFR